MQSLSVAPRVRPPRPSLRIDADPAITLKVVAERLAKQTMYDGDTGDSFFSKAQHCCLVAQTVLLAGGPGVALRALLHHAADAIGDHQTEFERALAVKTLHRSVSLPYPNSDDDELIKLAHLRVELSERRQFGTAPRSRIEALLAGGVKPVTVAIRPVPWVQAADRFLLDLRSYASQAGGF
jgi:hypothetical protein